MRHLFVFVLALTTLLSSSCYSGPNQREDRAVEPKAPPLVPPTAPPTGLGDPDFTKAWQLTASGATEIWKLSKGDPTKLIAFVDGGIEYDHPDLAPNLAWNAAEWPPTGTDKDGNGFADDVIGWDFVRDGYLPWDTGGHGTFLSGLAAAVEGNGLGGAGICPRCRLLTCRFMDLQGFGDTEDAIRGIRYATRKRATVINVSFSGEGYDSHLFDAIKAAGDSDIVVVAAASNDGANLDYEEIYPAKFSLPNLITVAAHDSRDALWTYSNFGKKTVHLAAPGAEVWSTDLKKTYDAGSGTSDAAAVLSGAVGLLRSVAPSLTAPQVVGILTATARRSPALAGKLRSDGALDLVAAVRCAVTAGLPCLHD